VVQPCGTDAAYQRGCTCDLCREAHRVAEARWRGRDERALPTCGCGARIYRRRGESPATCYRCSVRRRSGSCVGCGLAIGPSRKYCDPCRVDATLEATRRARRKRRAIRAALQRGGRVERFTEVEIFERDGWRCHICRRKVRRKPRWPLDPERASLDHLWPLSRGGDHTRDNVACAHLACNMRKSARVAEGVQLLLVG